MDKDKLAVGSVSAILGALVPAIISLNIFATKADIAEMKAYMAEKYIQKSEVEHRLEKIERVLEKLAEKLFSPSPQHRGGH